MARIYGILLLCVCVVFIEAQSDAFGGSPQSVCSFSSSCTDITFQGHVMHATCRTVSGDVLRSSINVNNCVGVDYHGKLNCSTANFAHSCSDVAFNGITVTARCNIGDGYTALSNRALDECIGNNDGKLSCC